MGRDWDEQMRSAALSEFLDDHALETRGQLLGSVLRRTGRHARLAAWEARSLAGLWRASRRLPDDAGPDLAFVWIPKTAGTSLWAALSAQGGVKAKSAASLRLFFPQRGIMTPGHLSWQAAVDAGLISAQYARSAVTFTIVRNPYDRAISLYEYLKGVRVDPGVTFETFLRVVDESQIPAPGLVNSVGLSQCAPQCAWIVDRRGTVFPHHVGRIEAMSESVDFLETFLGRRLEIPRLNASRRKESHDYLTPTTRSLIESIYRQDFETLGY